MKKDHNPYRSFSSFVLRTPLYDIDFFKDLTKEEQVPDNTFLNLFNDLTIKEAIFLASPALYFELEKWSEGEHDPKKKEKLIFSFLKYLTRMSSRCTPFGLFAGCALGTIADKTELRISGTAGYKRFTRPDMNYLVALSQDLAKRDHVVKQLRFFPNSSIYRSGDQLRYVEYYYIESRRQHHIIEVDHSPYLQKILTEAVSGATIEALVHSIVDEEVTQQEARSFVEELVDSQLLVSELEPSVSGIPFTDQILGVLKGKEQCGQEIKFLEQLQEAFADLDESFGNSPDEYLNISELVKSQPTKFELKYLFQTDMELSTQACTLSKEIIGDAMKAMKLFNRITPKPAETDLSRFREAFVRRYEDREMPLYKVLDVETGIGYLQDTGSGDINPLIDDLVLPASPDPFNQRETKWNKVHNILSNKLMEALKEGKPCILLEDSDFEDLPEDWSDLPDTLSTMAELVADGTGQKLKISGFSGSSAANLLGRFAHEGSSIEKFTKEITALEEKLNPDQILAEIIHLPESRVGNILMRPKLREYEIPYLAKSNLPSSNQIKIEDLYISVKGNRIVLRSKELNKEIIPRLTNAHNYAANALPIYHFLSDLQSQNLRKWIGFRFGPVSQQYKFLPRVEYKNMILHLAQWNLEKNDVHKLFSAQDSIAPLQTAIQDFVRQWNLPQWVLLSEGDNELLINFDCLTSVKMLLDVIRNRPAFTLTEFLYQKDSAVKSSKGHFSNQIILAFYNQAKISRGTQKSTNRD